MSKESLEKAGPPSRRSKSPGFDSFDPTPVGKYMVKVSISAGPLMCLAYWVGKDYSFMVDEGARLAMTLNDARRTIQIRFFTDEEKAKVFINKLADEH